MKEKPKSPKRTKQGKGKGPRRGSSKRASALIEFGPDILRQVGPVLGITWNAPDVVQEARAAEGLEVPEVNGFALLDTGAVNTCIAMKVAERLRLTPSRVQVTRGAGGESQNPVFFAQLQMVVEQKSGKTVLKWQQEVVGVPKLSDSLIPFDGQMHPLTGLIGRDILSHANFEYNGTKGFLRLTFNLESMRKRRG